MSIGLIAEHGYVFLAASLTLVLNGWQMSKIGGLRKSLGIKVSIYNSFIVLGMLGPGNLSTVRLGSEQRIHIWLQCPG